MDRDLTDFLTNLAAVMGMDEDDVAKTLMDNVPAVAELLSSATEEPPPEAQEAMSRARRTFRAAKIRDVEGAVARWCRARGIRYEAPRA